MNVAARRRIIGRALDLTSERVRRMAQLGMPLDSIEAALAWRKQHVPRGRKPPKFGLGAAIPTSD